jgi:dCMP deaminase
MRLPWDQYFLNMATIVAEQSTCIRRHVGAVIVRDKQILSTGFNGAPQHVEHCDKRGCIRLDQNVPSGERHELCMGSHAEMNAIAHAAKHGISINGSVLYCTHYPCAICAKLIINAGIISVKYIHHYDDALTIVLLKEGLVSIQKF